MRGGEPRVSVSPAKFDPAAGKPGDEFHFVLRIRNTEREAVRLRVEAIALEGSSRTEAFAQPAGRGAHSAVATEWVSFPGFVEARDLGRRRQLEVPVTVRVPSGARPGTYALGFAVTLSVSAPATSIGDSTRIDLDASPTSIAVVRVLGQVSPEARIRELDAPRIVWGSDSPTFRVRVENVGDTDLTLDGKVELDAFLGSAGRTLDAAGAKAGQPTLPDGQRTLVMRWGDPPLLGWFEPELVVVGGAGSDVRITRRLDTVYVLPPWWLLALLALAIALPVWARRRRRRQPGWQGLQAARARARVEERLRVEQAKERAAQARGPRR